MSDEAAFAIDGRDYPIPALDDLTLDELVVVYDHTKMTLEEVEEQAGKGLSPRVVRALVHIAYARGNPHLPETEILETIGQIKLMDLASQLAAAEGDVSPPIPASSDGSSQSENGSGSGSTSGSAALATGQEPIGGQPSGTPSSAPASRLTKLAV